MSSRGAAAMAEVRLRCRMVEEISKGKPYHIACFINHARSMFCTVRACSEPTPQFVFVNRPGR